MPRRVNATVLSAADSMLGTGIQIDANQLYAASFHAFFGDASASGVLKVQMSNDIDKVSYQSSAGFTATNWSDIPSASVSISSGTSELILIYPNSSRWLRTVFTPTASAHGQQTIKPVADTGSFNVTNGTFNTADTGGQQGAYVESTEQAPVQGDYIWLPAATGGNSQAVWLSVDGNNTPPTGTHYLNATTKTKVSVSSSDSYQQIIDAVAAVTYTTGWIPYDDGVSEAVIYSQNVLASAPNVMVLGAADGPCSTFANILDGTGAPSNLQNTYFLFNDANNVHNYYVWMNICGFGTDPMIAGRTGIECLIANTASTEGPYDGTDTTDLATAIAAAITSSSASTYVTATSSSNVVTITDNQFGPSTHASDGAAPIGVTFTYTAGVNSNLNDTYFLLSDALNVHNYYVWMNVNSQGVDPMIAGRTGVEISFAAGATAATIGADLATAIAALNSTNSFTATGTTTVTVTNKVTGYFTPAADGADPTDFTFTLINSGTTGTSTITVNMEAQSI